MLTFCYSIQEGPLFLDFGWYRFPFLEAAINGAEKIAKEVEAENFHNGRRQNYIEIIRQRLRWFVRAGIRSQNDVA